MAPNTTERDALFKSFGRAFFKCDVDALYECCTPDFNWMTLDEDGTTKTVTGKSAVAEHLKRRSSRHISKTPGSRTSTTTTRLMQPS